MDKVEKVLIADDEEDLTWVLSKSLSKARPRLQVDCFDNGRTAFESCRRRNYDVVVSDVRMPGMNGIELATAIRQLTRHTRIILMTAHSLRELNDNDDLPGLFAVMQKPFDMLEMKETIFKALEQGYNTSLYGKGSIANNRIRYIIETNCVQRRNSALRVSRNSQRGAIYIKDGSVIHAECGNLSGETALYSMLDWVDGRYEIGRDNSQVPRTILRDWHTIKCQ